MAAPADVVDASASIADRVAFLLISSVFILMARLAAAAFSLAAHATLACHHTAPVVTARPLPPGPLNIAYPSGGECDAKVIDAVTSGLNVVIWSFINLGSDAQGNPTILLDQAPDFDCVANLANEMKARNLNTTHMISIGGWGSPHPAITNNPHAVYQSWKDWNEKVVARNGWPGFDGMDVSRRCVWHWDIVPRHALVHRCNVLWRAS